MRCFPLLPFLAAVAAACGDPTEAGGDPPVLSTVNGAVHPALLRGETFVATGRGFGASAEGRSLLVSGASGRVPAEILDWRDDAIVARLPADAATGSLIILRGPGDTLGPLSLFVRTTEAFDPATLDWKSGPDLPRGLTGFQLAGLRYPDQAALTAIAVAMAGRTAARRVTDSTYFGFAAAAGGVSNWASAPQDSAIPEPRRLAALAGADRTTSRIALTDAVAYLIGGLDSLGRALPDVFGIGVSRNAEYSLWTPFALLPRARAGASAVAGWGNLYVAGGFGSDSLALREVLVAVVDSQVGAPNGWFQGPPLPEGRALGALVLWDDRLFYLGGETGVIDPDSTAPASPDLRATVYSIRLSRRTGFFLDSVWTAVGPLVGARSRHAAFALQNGLLVTGGVYAGAPGPIESEFAALAPDGTLGPFAAVPAPTISARGGGAVRDMAFTTLWDARGVPHPVLAGGRTGPDSIVARTWWH